MGVPGHGGRRPPDQPRLHGLAPLPGRQRDPRTRRRCLMLPPVWVRRLIIAPAVVVLSVVLLATLPVWLIVALAASPLVPGRLRVPRLVFLAIAYVVWDAAALVFLAALWVGSGCGW